MTHYAITTFGTPSHGRQKRYYLSLDSAISDAREVGGGSCCTVRVLAVPTRTASERATIADKYQVVWQS